MKSLWLVLFLVGCGTMQRSCAGFTGNFVTRCSPSGVEYLVNDSGIAVHVDLEGKPIACKGEK